MQQLASTIRGMMLAATVSSVLSACGGGGGLSVQSAAIPPPPVSTAPQQQVCPLPGLDGWITCMTYASHMQYLYDILSGKVQPSSGGFNFDAFPPAVTLPANNPLSYANWGPWGTNDDVTAAPTGTLTAPDAIPHSGLASYSGYASGTMTRADPRFPATTPFDAKASVQVDFQSGKVDARLSGQLYGYDFSGTVAGNTYSGASDTNSGSVHTSSSFSGAFYGPGAAETAGRFQSTTVDSTDPLSALGVRGTFGAKLCPGGMSC